MTLQIYLARRFLMTFVGMFGAFLILFLLIEMLETLRRFDVARIGFSEIVRLTALNTPNSLYQVTPLIVILSTIGMFLGLSRSSELVVIRAAGRSALRSVVPPVVVSALVATFLITIFNPIVASTLRQFDTLSNAHLRGQESILSVSAQGLWLRQGDANEQTVIHAARSNVDGTSLFDVTFITLDAAGRAITRVEAENAILETGAWRLGQAKIWELSGEQNPEAGAITVDEAVFPTDLTKEGIEDGFGRPATIPIWQLPTFINRLENAGFSAKRHKTWFHAELAKPAFFIAMVLIGAAFTMRHSRLQRTGILVLSAVLLGFLAYFIRNFAIVLAENGQLPPVLAAWAPPSATVLLALGLILHYEDG